jgi:hypothetical protein
MIAGQRRCFFTIIRSQAGAGRSLGRRCSIIPAWVRWGSIVPRRLSGRMVKRRQFVPAWDGGGLTLFSHGRKRKRGVNSSP